MGRRICVYIFYQSGVSKDVWGSSEFLAVEGVQVQIDMTGMEQNIPKL